MFCANCGKRIEGAGKFCPKCGAPLAAEEKKRRQVVNETEQKNRINMPLDWKSIAACVGAAAIFIIIIGMTIRGTNQTRDSYPQIEFTVVGVDQQPDALKDIILEKCTEPRPFELSYTLGESLYIAVGYGEQPEHGYSISVNSFYETENSLVICTTLIEPGENATKKPSYPYIVVKTENRQDKTVEFEKIEGSSSASETNTADVAETDITDTDETYVPGVYTSILLLGSSYDVELQITVDKDHINAIDIVYMDESVAMLYPLLEPTLQQLSETILEKQSIEGISYGSENRFTSMLLIQAITEALDKAYVSENTESPVI